MLKIHLECVFSSVFVNLQQLAIISFCVVLPITHIIRVLGETSNAAAALKIADP